jgi:hypothetical protein
MMLNSDTKWYWTSLLDGSWINCDKNIQQENRCLDIWNCWFVNSLKSQLIIHNKLNHFNFSLTLHFFLICCCHCCDDFLWIDELMLSLWNCCTMWTSQRCGCSPNGSSYSVSHWIIKLNQSNISFSFLFPFD